LDDGKWSDFIMPPDIPFNALLMFIVNLLYIF